MTRGDDEIFSDALVLPATERAAFLARTCDGDATQRARVEALLAGHAEAAMFLQQPLAPRGMAPAEEHPGTEIGRYKLLAKIGEGGCGVVWLAEQTEPVRRRVALKVIKLGMDTKEVIARFEAERQALALMDHPNIAMVHDGGATASGRPYFVMELVRGVPITRYCDEHQLTLAQRIELMIPVCQAIQHAHQKGIIHRDIKPSNILVVDAEIWRRDSPVAASGRNTPRVHELPLSVLPKVIDFGIAKATQGKLTEHTAYTVTHQFIGTPAYMSPEQAELSIGDIDTRSDIYSLGVLLYELLTGETPFDRMSRAGLGLDEIRQQIRTVEPPRPSARFRTLNDATRTSVAQLRGASPPQLSSTLRGDLDWIVMRCLEKDRARRYATANGLALDLQRYLRHEPIVARPPSAAYPVLKLIRRHRLAFGAAAAIMAVLILGAAVSMSQAMRATRAEREEWRLRRNEESLRRNAEAQALASRRRAYAAEMLLLQQAVADRDLGLARQLLERQRPAPGEADLRGWEWRYLWQLCRDATSAGAAPPEEPTAVELAGAGPRRAIDFNFATRAVTLSPDGTRRVEAGSGRSALVLWEVAGQNCVLQLAAKEAPFSTVEFSPNGDMLRAKNPAGELRIWRAPSWAEIAAEEVSAARKP